MGSLTKAAINQSFNEQFSSSIRRRYLDCFPSDACMFQVHDDFVHLNVDEKVPYWVSFWERMKKEADKKGIMLKDSDFTDFGNMWIASIEKITDVENRIKSYKKK